MPNKTVVKQQNPNPQLGSPPKYLTSEEKKLWWELATAAPPGRFAISDRWIMEVTVCLLAKVRTGAANKVVERQLMYCLTQMKFTSSERMRLAGIAP
jgi:hypothetical protein